MSVDEIAREFNAEIVDLPEELEQEAFLRAWNDAQPAVDLKSLRPEPRWTGAPYARRRPTSQAASISAAGRKRSQQQAVLDGIRRLGPLTDEAIASHLNLNSNSARPRRIELERAGEIKEAGRALTRSGRMAVTWKVT